MALFTEFYAELWRGRNLDSVSESSTSGTLRGRGDQKLGKILPNKSHLLGFVLQDRVREYPKVILATTRPEAAVVIPVSLPLPLASRQTIVSCSSAKQLLWSLESGLNKSDKVILRARTPFQQEFRTQQTSDGTHCLTEQV